MGRFVSFYNVQMRIWLKRAQGGSGAGGGRGGKERKSAHMHFLSCESKYKQIVCVCFYVIHFINQWLTKQNTIVFAGKIRTEFLTVGYVQK